MRPLLQRWPTKRKRKLRHTGRSEGKGQLQTPSTSNSKSLGIANKRPPSCHFNLVKLVVYPRFPQKRNFAAMLHILIQNSIPISTFYRRINIPYIIFKSIAMQVIVPDGLNVECSSSRSKQQVGTNRLKYQISDARVIRPIPHISSNILRPSQLQNGSPIPNTP